MAAHSLFIMFGVPQGSFPRPIMFLLYTADLLRHQNKELPPTSLRRWCTDIQFLPSWWHGRAARMFIWLHQWRGFVVGIQAITAECLADWSALVQHQIPIAQITVGSTTVTPVRAVCELGIYIALGLTMQMHVAETVSSCFAVLRRIRNIRRSATKPVLQSLVVFTVLTCLEYESSDSCRSAQCVARSTSERTTRRRTTDLLGSEARSRSSITPRAPLVMSSRI